MPTIKQKKLAKELLTGKHTSIKSALMAAGYTERTALQGKRILKQKGVQAILDKAGLKVDTLAEMLKDDLHAKEGDRARELEMAFKLQDAFPAKHTEIDIYQHYSDEQLVALLKQRLNVIDLDYDPKSNSFRPKDNRTDAEDGGGASETGEKA